MRASTPSTLQETAHSKRRQPSRANQGGTFSSHISYFGIRDELSVDDDVAVRSRRKISDSKIAGSRSDASPSLAHSSVVSSLSRARGCIYCPGMSSEIEQFIETCDVCRSYDKRQPEETLITHEVPDRPWAKVGIDLFSCRSRYYLICVDNHSSFWEVDLLEGTRSATVIRKLNAQFARHGISETCLSENGSQNSDTTEAQVKQGRSLSKQGRAVTASLSRDSLSQVPRQLSCLSTQGQHAQGEL